MGSSVNVALPAISAEFKIDAVMLNWIATSYLLASAIFLVPLGKLADMIGRKKVFISGLIVFTLFTLLSSFAVNVEMLIAFRVVQGIGSAMIFGTGMAIVTSVFPPKERGKALGINVAAVYLALSLGPLFGGVLTDWLGWHSIFLFAVIPGSVAIIISVIMLKGEWKDSHGQKFDFIGSILYMIAMVSLIYGLSKLTTPLGIIFAVSGLVLLFIFILYERKTAFPVIPISLFTTNKAFAFSNLTALINYSATFAITFLLSLYLQYIDALSARDAGLVLVIQPIVMTIFSPLAGILSDRINPGHVATAGMIVTIAGLCGIFFLDAETSRAYIIACLLVFGMGFALFSSPNTNAIMSSVERKDFGLASSMVGTMRLTGQMFSMSVCMVVFSSVIGPRQITKEVYPEFLQSLQIIFGIFIVLCVLGTFASHIRGKSSIQKAS
ncbi:MAG: MFS transporter [Bacteroidota bacterium]